MSLRSVKDVAVKDKKVFLRVDFNVPLKEDGSVSDNTRILKTLPTIDYLLQEGAAIVIASHLGRPKGKIVEALRLTGVAEELGKLLNRPVKKMDDCIGAEVSRAKKELQPGEILMLENLRFHVDETDNIMQFAKILAEDCDLFVEDAFGCVHRAHASTEGIAHFLPAYAGLLLKKEVSALKEAFQAQKKPLVLIMGGAKIDTKIGVLRNFLHKADTFLIGGGLANTFLYARGFDIGASLCEKDKAPLAREIMLEAEKYKERIILPNDVKVASEAADNAEVVDLPVEDVEGDMKIFDLGKISLQRFKEVIESAGAIVWNGPVGYFECKPFEEGTRVIAEAVAKSKAKTIIGGGDTLEALTRFNIAEDNFSHVSTGGGAMLEFLEGKVLPGLAVLNQ